MRPTTVIGVFSLIIIGVIVADIWANPGGTQAASNGAVAILKPSYNALLGRPS